VAETNHTNNCNSCKFFSFGDQMGSCKRYPETKNKSPNDWCGEYVLKNIMYESIINQLVVNFGETEPLPKKRGRPAKCK